MLPSIAIIAALGSLATGLDAAVVSFSINQTFSQGAGQSDLPLTHVLIGGAGSFFVDPGDSSNYFDFQFAGTGTFSTSGSITDMWNDTYYILESFGPGSLIDSTTVGTDVSPLEDWDTILVDG